MPDVKKLSVHIVTYNHARFVGQALDSVLMQRVDSDYEIIVGDDCSSDGTIAILQDYQRRFPDKIKLVLRERNLGPGPNAVDILERCSGEYVAFLEGDDYWTDKDKLRIQVEYLNQHADCALVHHRVRHISWPAGAVLGELPRAQFRVEKSTPRTLAMANYVQTCSVVFRRRCLPILDEGFRCLKIGDWPLFVLVSQNGWIGFIDRVMSEYRIHNSNNWNNRPPDYKLRAMETMAWYLLDRVNENLRGYWRDTILALALKDAALSLRSGDWVQFTKKLKYFIESSWKFKKPLWLLNSLVPYYRANCG